jgi:hypothetical protein
MRLVVVKLGPLREVVVGVKKGVMAINHPIEALIARFFFHHNAQQSPGRADNPRPFEKQNDYPHPRPHPRRPGMGPTSAPTSARDPLNYEFRSVRTYSFLGDCRVVFGTLPRRFVQNSQPGVEAARLGYAFSGE